MRIKKIFALAIVFTMLLLAVVGCGMPDKKDDGNAPETTPPDNQTLVDEANAVPFSEFVIVYGDGADQELLDTTSDFRMKIMVLVGGKAPDVVTDKKSENEKEILVGNTNRKSASGLLRSQFQISFKNGKLAILGGSDKSVAEGVAYFLDNLT